MEEQRGWERSEAGQRRGAGAGGCGKPGLPGWRTRLAKSVGREA